MNTRACSVLLALTIIGFLRAGDGSPHEQAIRQMLGNLEEIGKILKAVDSEEAANAARPALRKEAQSWIETRSKAAKLQPPERDEKDRLTKLYRPKIDEALRKMFTEARRVEIIPGGKEALKEISGVLKKDTK